MSISRDRLPIISGPKPKKLESPSFSYSISHNAMKWINKKVMLVPQESLIIIVSSNGSRISLLDVHVCLLCDALPILGQSKLELVEVVEFVVEETNAMLASQYLLH